MEESPGEHRRFMNAESPEIKYLGEYGGSLIGLLKFSGVRVQGYVECAEGIRVPFDRDKALERARRMRMQADIDNTIDQILGDES